MCIRDRREGGRERERERATHNPTSPSHSSPSSPPLAHSPYALCTLIAAPAICYLSIAHRIAAYLISLQYVA
eukprot:2015791-Rhodomonas_salina.1